MRPAFSKIAASLAFAAIIGTAALSTTASLGDQSAPYSRVPIPGDKVRLDATLGGATSAWAYYDQMWLEQYLKVTIDAAETNRPYGDVSNKLSAIADHVTKVANGTGATVESVQPFAYSGHIDVEIRVLISEGPQKGRELWTTCAEVVDSAGHPYIKS